MKLMNINGRYINLDNIVSFNYVTEERLLRIRILGMEMYVEVSLDETSYGVFLAKVEKYSGGIL